MSKEINVLLYSSGVDSFIAYNYLKTAKEINVIPVFVDLGHKYRTNELRYIMKYRPETVILNLKDYAPALENNMAYIPNRNLVLCTLVSSYFSEYADDMNIYFASLRDDRISDNSPESFELFSKALSISLDKKVSVMSAFNFELCKKDIVDWHYKQFPDIDLDESTFSCYHPIETSEFSDLRCNNCRACFRKNVALFDHSKIIMHDTMLLAKYRKEMTDNKDKYDPVRYEQSLKYINWCIGLRSK